MLFLYQLIAQSPRHDAKSHLVHSLLANHQANLRCNHPLIPAHNHLASRRFNHQANLRCDRLVNLRCSPHRSHSLSPVHSLLRSHRGNLCYNHPLIPAPNHLASRRVNHQANLANPVRSLHRNHPLAEFTAFWSAF